MSPAHNFLKRNRLVKNLHMKLLILLPLLATLLFSGACKRVKFHKVKSSIMSKNVRFQFLSPGLVRMEFEPKGEFVNAPTTVVVKRDWPIVDVNATMKNGWLTAKTSAITLRYKLNSGTFTSNNLSIEWKDTTGKHTWYPGDNDPKNLGGITHSLDGIHKRGLPKFPQGLLSRNGYFLLHDSKSPAWDSTAQWIKPRRGMKNQDWYFFAYGHHYKKALKEYAELSGNIPMIPRYALGNWITDLNYEYLPGSKMVRDYKYGETHLRKLIEKFRDDNIPFDVLVLDFAWHKYGWKGGYDWSPNIPNPKSFLAWLHKEGVKVSINDHPGYGNESVLSDSDSHAAEVRKELDMPIPPNPTFHQELTKYWKFKTDNENKGIPQKWFATTFNDNHWKSIAAGRDWESQGYPGYDGVAWYRKTFMLPASVPDSLYLVFGGVDDEYDLYINGQKAAHYGSRPDHSVYNSKTVTNIRQYVKAGQANLIAVRVDDWGGGGGLTKNPQIIQNTLPPQGIHFNLAIKKQARVFWDVLHKPLMKEGVDFWWIDGGSGSAEMKGLNNQLWTNRIYYDSTQATTGKRGFIFSRYGDWGSQRYPAFFTGDTYSQWSVLKYEVPYTAQAGNVLTPYVTHDIGGFHGAKINYDLYARWVEFGAFSPILRLHSAHENPEEGNVRMPWTYGKNGVALVKKYFTLRNQLNPYIYTFSWIAHKKALPIVRPLYLEYPNLDVAYHHPYEYFFGSEMLVAPIVDSTNTRTIYLPPGTWYDYFTGKKYVGGRTFIATYGVNSIPVFVKSGSIIPLQNKMDYIGQRPVNPLTLQIFAPDSATFELYEDDGQSLKFKNNEYALTTIKFKRLRRNNWQVFIGPERGTYDGQLSERAYHLQIHNITKPVSVASNGHEIQNTKSGNQGWSWDELRRVFDVRIARHNIRTSLEIDIRQ
jgi:alpha-glucosidase (family GH31 glycosyl hydrolase)